jgi:hypothetical protein
MISGLQATIYAVLTLWLLTLSVVVWQFYKTKSGVIRMASAWANKMAGESADVRREKVDTRARDSGQAKIVDAIATQIPGAASMLKSAGVNDQEAWALVTDPNTMKGIKVIFETLGGAVKFLDKAQEKKPKRGRSRAGEAPLIELKHE